MSTDTPVRRERHSFGNPEARCIPRVCIEPSPLNPRKRFSEEELQQLAGSIREHGILQPLSVRPKAGTRDRWEIVAGERRWRAAGLLGLEYLPCQVVCMDDREVLAAMLAENVARQDLSPWEEILGLQALLDAGMSQAEAGRSVGRSQSAVANLVKLLKLPPRVQELLAEGKLNRAQAQAIYRFAGWPDYCVHVAEAAAAEGLPESALREGLPAWKSAEQAGVVAQFRWPYLFRQEEVCRGCEFYAQVQGYQLCFKPEHKRELEAAAQAEQEARARAAQERALDKQAARDRKLDQLRQLAREAGGAAHVDLPAAAGAETPPAPAAKAGKKPPAPIYWRDIKYEYLPGTYQCRYEELPLARLPAGCAGEECPCAVPLPRSSDDPTIVWVCRDGKRFRRLVSATKKAARKDRKEELEDRCRLLRVRMFDAGGISSRMLAPLVNGQLTSARQETLAAAFAALDIPCAPELWDMHGHYAWGKVVRELRLDALARLPALTLLRLWWFLQAEESLTDALVNDLDRLECVDWFLEEPLPDQEIAFLRDRAGNADDLSALNAALVQSGLAPLPDPAGPEEDAGPAHSAPNTPGATEED